MTDDGVSKFKKKKGDVSVMKILPFLIIFLLFGCQSSSKELPILSYTIDASGNMAYYGINYKDFTNQLGQDFTTLNITDKVFIANFFFTRCPSICPPMRNELIKIAEKFKSFDDFLIISHTIDPENDTLDVLKIYSATTGIPSDTWQFVRSTEENTKKQAHAYMTNFKPNSDGTDFYHSSFVALVDKDKFIRGFYNVLVKEEVERLNENILSLLD